MPKKATIQPSLSRQVAKEMIERFYQVVGDLRDSRESKLFFLDFLTESERLTFAKRLAIALELEKKKSYEEIRKLYGVSSATISSVAEMIQTPGMQLALKKINTEKWADQMTNSFFQLFGVKEDAKKS